MKGCDRTLSWVISPSALDVVEVRLGTGFNNVDRRARFILKYREGSLAWKKGARKATCAIGSVLKDGSKALIDGSESSQTIGWAMLIDVESHPRGLCC